jgi:hypothetical protein
VPVPVSYSVEGEVSGSKLWESACQTVVTVDLMGIDFAVRVSPLLLKADTCKVISIVHVTVSLAEGVLPSCSTVKGKVKTYEPSALFLKDAV